MKKAPSKRKVLLINPEFQLKVIALTSALCGIVVVIIYSGVWLFFWRFKQLGHKIGLPEEHLYFKFVGDQQVFMNWIIVITLIFVVLVVFLGGLYLSNKVAGPLYRLRVDLESFNDGAPLRPLKFREGDYFQEILPAINRMIAKFAEIQNKDKGNGDG